MARVNPMLVFTCSHGHRPAHSCPGSTCKPMTYEEIIAYCREMSPTEDEAIATAFELGKRIGWTRKEL